MTIIWSRLGDGDRLWPTKIRLAADFGSPAGALWRTWGRPKPGLRVVFRACTDQILAAVQRLPWQSLFNFYDFSESENPCFLSTGLGWPAKVVPAFAGFEPVGGDPPTGSNYGNFDF